MHQDMEAGMFTEVIKTIWWLNWGIVTHGIIFSRENKWTKKMWPNLSNNVEWQKEVAKDYNYCKTLYKIQNSKTEQYVGWAYYVHENDIFKGEKALYIL